MPFPQLLEAVAQALDAGVDYVQLRDKQASAAAMYSQAAQLRSVIERHGGQLAVNDRLDIGLAVGAAAVHLSGQGLPVAAACSVAHPRLLVGRSVHSLDEAIEVAGGGADYITFGHVFPTQSKAGLDPRGVVELRRIVEAVPVPVMAIGGINVSNVEDVLATGCAGIAVISAILSAKSPFQAAAALRSALDSSSARPRFIFPQLPNKEQKHEPHRQSAAV